MVELYLSALIDYSRLKVGLVRLSLGSGSLSGQALSGQALSRVRLSLGPPLLSLDHLRPLVSRHQTEYHLTHQLAVCLFFGTTLSFLRVAFQK